LTLNTVAQGAWAVLLAWLTGREDVIFGCTVAGRPPEIPGVERIVGLLINTLPVRVQVHPQERFATSWRGCNRSSRIDAASAPGPFADPADSGLGELFDTLVVFENYPLDRDVLERDASGLHITSTATYDATHYALCAAVLPGARLQFRLQYRPDLFDRETVEALSERWVRLLEAVVADADRPIGAIELLSAEERHRVLVEWTDTVHRVEQTTLPALIEAQVERTPEAAAVVFAGEELSYAELNRRANRLAHSLIAEGIGAEDIVALSLPRSVEMIVGLVGC